MTIFTVPASGGGGGGGPGPPGPPGPANMALSYSHDGGVLSSGTRYLGLAQGVLSSQAGALSTADCTLVGVSFNVDVLDAASSYSVEVLSDPSGGGGTGPVVLATLAFPAGTLRARDRTLSVAVAGLLDLGVRVVRTAGPSVPSSFSEMVAVIEVTIP